MASFKSHPVFSSLLVILGLAAVGEGWFIYAGHRDKNAALKKLWTAKAAINTLNQSKIPLTTENADLIKQDLADSTANLALMQSLLKGKGDTADQLRSAAIPADSPDAYFVLNKFVEDTRKKYQDAGIKIKDGERFGFSTYSNKGPDPELIPEVFHQQQLASYLLNALYDAKPSELISLQRERPLTTTERHDLDYPKPPVQGAPVAVPAPPAGETGTDIFDIDPRITARHPGFVDAVAFRLTFVGKTDVLRSLLNKVGKFELPLVVRSVEVEAGDPEPTPAAPTVDADGHELAAPPKPKVDKLLSKFTVTIESIDLVPAAQTPSAPAP
jgi:hypothetical protein